MTAVHPRQGEGVAEAVSRVTAAVDAPFDAYDAGLLGFGGGGDIDWWQDYLRSELERADHHYRAQSEHLAEQVASDLRLILSALSAQAEALMAAQSFIADGGLAEMDPGASVYRQVTAALSQYRQTKEDTA